MTNSIQLLHDDKKIIAAVKPAGLLAYPLPNRDEKSIGEILGATAAHRLDRDTSGVMLLARDEKTLSDLRGLFKTRKIEKRYKVLVWGKVTPERGEINIPLGRGSKDRMRVVPKGGGRESRTVYEVKKYFPDSNMSLCDVDLKTGRTHQIRVHFSAIGHPVVGDDKYSNRKTKLKRQFLHSYRISFLNPSDGKKMIFTSELPSDLSDYLKDI